MHTCKPVLKFDNSFLTGVSEIDTQHRILVDLINEADASLHQDRSAAKLKQIVHELLSYAIYHFKTEEELMQKHGYQRLEPEEAKAHIQSHRAFSTQIAAIQEMLHCHEFVDAGKLVTFLCQWINDHIMHTDQLLARHIQAQSTA